MEEKTLNISAVQMCADIGNKYNNFKKVQYLAERDINNGDVDVIVLPEVWTVGWHCSNFIKSAEPAETNETLDFLSELARKFNAYVLGGSYIEKNNEQYFNTCPVFDRNGKLVAKYSKMHLYSSYGADENKYITAGYSPVMIDIDGIKTGLTICYDIRFPEIFRAYRKAGAELLINMAAWGLHKPIPWETLTRCRAIENQAFMVALTQSGKITDDEWNIGHSRIFNYTGETIVEIKDQNEGAISASLDFALLRKYRKECQIMNDIAESYEVKYYEKIH